MIISNSILKGRPKKADDDLKSHRLNVRLTEQELMAVKKMADHHQRKTKAEYIRWLIHQDMKRNKMIKKLGGFDV